MTADNTTSSIAPYAPSPARLAGWVLMQGMVILMAGLNIHLGLMDTPLAAAPFLAWQQVIAMLLITPLSLIVAFFTMEELAGSARKNPALYCLFIFSALLIAIGMGMHEPINILRWKMKMIGEQSSAGMTMYFLDEVFSHWVFFASYAGLCLSFAWGQSRNPVFNPILPWMWVVFGGGCVIGASGIIASLYGTPLNKIAYDLAIMAGIILGCELLLRLGGKRTRQPITTCIQAGNLIAFVVLVLQGCCR
jgi:hypothetical protein